MFKPNYLKSDQQIDVQAKWDGVTTIKREVEQTQLLRVHVRVRVTSSCWGRNNVFYALALQ